MLLCIFFWGLLFFFHAGSVIFSSVRFHIYLPAFVCKPACLFFRLSCFFTSYFQRTRQFWPPLPATLFGGACSAQLPAISTSYPWRASSPEQAGPGFFVVLTAYGFLRSSSSFFSLVPVLTLVLGNTCVLPTTVVYVPIRVFFIEQNCFGDVLDALTSFFSVPLLHPPRASGPPLRPSVVRYR